MCNLLDTMSTETGERNAQAAEKTALETVIEDTEAELAKLQRSKVANMIRLYQGELFVPTMHSGTRQSPPEPSHNILRVSLLLKFRSAWSLLSTRTPSEGIASTMEVSF